VRTNVSACASIIPIILAATGCAWWEDYYPQFKSRSPDGQTELRVMRNLPSYAADYRFKVELSTARGEIVIHSEPQESAIGLVEIYWSANGTQMGLLVCDMLSGPVFLSYDVAHRQLLPPLTFRHFLEGQIKHKYAAADQEDLIGWACSQRGNAAYTALIPRAPRNDGSPTR
jgi:hypothetical protein